MIWYIVCILGGAFVGLIIAAIMGACAKGQDEHDLIHAWYDGYEAGKRVKQGQELMNMTRKVQGG